MRLSILIPTIRRHYRLLGLLRLELNSQILPYAGEIEVLVDDEEKDPVGMKRNRLLKRAKGDYVCFFDADDYPGTNYISSLMALTDQDCASLRGSYSVDGKYDGIFEHSIKYNKWETVEGEIKYLRYPNHLNAIKSCIAKAFRFPEINHGEDHDWSTKIFKSGLIKTEHYIDEIIYYYRYQTNKNEVV